VQKLSEKIKIIDMYDAYKNLLTKKQQDHFEKYYFYDLSFQEIGEIFNVSKSAICDSINKIQKILNNYEKMLSIIKKRNKILLYIKKYKQDEMAIEELLNYINKELSYYEKKPII